MQSLVDAALDQKHVFGLLRQGDGKSYVTGECIYYLMNKNIKSAICWKKKLVTHSIDNMDNFKMIRFLGYSFFPNGAFQLDSNILVSSLRLQYQFFPFVC